MLSRPICAAIPWAWSRAWVVSSIVARRWRLTVSGTPSAMIRTSRTYVNARTSLVRTFVVASYVSASERNRKPTPRIVVMYSGCDGSSSIFLRSQEMCTSSVLVGPNQ
jgi:hypothetical protein